MKASLNPAALDELVRKAQEHSHEINPRDAGLHVSDLVRCRRRSWYVRNGYVEPPHDVDTLIMFLMGQGHHSFLQTGQPELKLHWTSPSGFPVTGNVDMQQQDVDGPVELKTTRWSASKAIWDMQSYIEQLASYAVMMGHKREGRVHAFHLLGDYKGAKRSSGASWDIEFSDYELDRWEQEMDRRAAVIMADEPPDLSEHRDYECNYCPFLEAHGGVCEGSKGNKIKWFTAEEELSAARKALR